VTYLLLLSLHDIVRLKQRVLDVAGRNLHQMLQTANRHKSHVCRSKMLLAFKNTSRMVLRQTIKF
jgi:hypothetical protein